MACWVKISADNILKYFSYFSQKIDFQHFMQIVTLRDNWHEIVMTIFWNKIQKKTLSILIYMNVKSLFSWKNKKNIIIFHPLNLPREW